LKTVQCRRVENFARSRVRVTLAARHKNNTAGCDRDGRRFSFDTSIEWIRSILSSIYNILPILDGFSEDATDHPHTGRLQILARL
jgi:hypothetical protein